MSVTAGSTAAFSARAITASADSGVSLANSTRRASSTAASPWVAARCSTARYSFACHRSSCRSPNRSYARRKRVVGNRSSRYAYRANAPGLRTSESITCR